MLMPAASLLVIKKVYQEKKDFIGSILREGVDYGTIPGSAKPALYKPGAEKMSSFFNLAPSFEDIEKVEDWTGENHGGEPFFYYRIRCHMFVGDRRIASADGSCNSMETKYRYRWVGDSDIPAGFEKTKLKTAGGRISEFTFAVDKSETGGKYGKPAAYWQSFKDAIASGQARSIKKKIKSGEEWDAWEIDSTLYRVPNNEISDLVNTILKMAQKRALVAVTLIATGTSEYFTQDIDDFIDPNSHPEVVGKVIEGEFKADTHADKVAQVLSGPEPNGELAAEDLDRQILSEMDKQTSAKPAPKPGDMTLEEAENVIGEDGVRYGDCDNETLRKKTFGHTKNLNGGKLKAKEQDAELFKLRACNLIINTREGKLSL
jgi:hypothetical protein